LALLVALVVDAAGASAAQGSVAYLHIEANEGGSSGGHAALELGRRVYHFQRHEDGLLRLESQETRRFVHLYGGLQNRAIHRFEVATPAAVRERLERAFSRRALVEEAHAALLDELRRDRELLEALAAGDPAVLSVPAAGYFDVGSGTDDAALASLRAAVAARRGPGFAAARARALREEIGALEPPEPGSLGFEPRLDVHPPPVPSLSRAASRRAAAIAAYEVLERAAPLRSDALFAPEGRTWRLSAGERAALARLAERLEGDLARLATRSVRSDVGWPLLVGMARLAALREAAGRGRLVFLDGFPADAPALPAHRFRPAAARGLDAVARQELRVARRRLVAARDPGERELLALESAAARLFELERGLREGSFVRVHEGPLVPSRPRAVELELARLAPGQAVAARDRARRREEELRSAVAELLGYRLLTRNCVTEIFHWIDEALAPDGDAPARAAASRAALGGHVAGSAFPTFIPFASARAAARHWHPVRVRRIPSHREAALAALRAREPDLLVALRESNVLTSSVYTPHPDDSPFLFFTAESGALRPVLGAANLATGVLATALGLPAAPFDGGARLRRGLRAVAASLPELLFVSIRKGSFDFVAPATGWYASEGPWTTHSPSPRTSSAPRDSRRPPR
jgi:hypothetical protein